MSIYTQEAVMAEVNYRLEVAQAHRRHTSASDTPARPSWWHRVRAESGTRQSVVRTTPATQ